jgi:hypothetical protein
MIISHSPNIEYRPHVHSLFNHNCVEIILFASPRLSILFVKQLSTIGVLEMGGASMQVSFVPADISAGTCGPDTRAK